MTNFEKVGLFMKTFNQDVKVSSSLSTDKINSLRISLINEELEELKDLPCITQDGWRVQLWVNIGLRTSGGSLSKGW